MVPAAASDPGVVRERKVKPDGTEHEYPLIAAIRTRHLVAGRFPLPRGIPPGTRLPITMPPGSSSDGYFWARRPYVVYRFRGPTGEAVAHRVDAVTDVRITDGTVTYRDLAVDWWILGNGSVIEEDREEFEDLLAAGVLSTRDADAVDRAERAVRGRWRAVAAELARLDERFDAGVSGRAPAGGD